MLCRNATGDCMSSNVVALALCGNATATCGGVAGPGAMPECKLQFARRSGMSALRIIFCYVANLANVTDGR